MRRFNNYSYNSFSRVEKDKARQNGFLLGGKTGSGKSTLLNVLCNKDYAQTARGATAVTKESTVYYHKLKDGQYISIIDTPGLSDPNMIQNKEQDNIHLKGIKKVIKEESIQLKGILFLVNFQEERFDNSEIEALKQYNTIFPLKKFWDYIIVIFTHKFNDPNGDSFEEMKENRDDSNQLLFSKIMHDIREISDPIEYKYLKTEYFNSYWPIKKPIQEKSNNQNKEKLEKILAEFTSKIPLFTRIEIVNIQNYKFTENGKNYIANADVTGYIGLDDKPIYEEIKYSNKKEITKQIHLDQKMELSVHAISAKKDEKTGELKTNVENNPTNSYYLKKFTCLGAGGMVGLGIGTLLFTNPAAIVGAGIVGIINGYLMSSSIK